MIDLTRIFAQISIPADQIEIPKTGTPNDNTLSTVLSFVFAIGAGIALIVIILAGIQFILSQGDPGKTSKARNTIIYAAIGLALCALAFSIVRFVLTRIS